MLASKVNVLNIIRVPIGQVLGDRSQQAIDWYVQGVEKAIPQATKS
jgi:hypothetical protein